MANPVARFSVFLVQVREEMTQVSWPTRSELISYAIVVFVGIALLAGFISVCDFLLSNAARLLLR